MKKILLLLLVTILSILSQEVFPFDALDYSSDDPPFMESRIIQDTENIYSL